jgi:hypothetical protein
MEDRKVKQVLYGGWYQWEGDNRRKGYKKMNIMKYYVLIMKMKK